MSGPLKVLHISSEYSWRGGEQQIAYLVKDLMKLKVDAHVICRKNSKMAEWCLTNQVPFWEINFKSPYDLISAFRLKSIFQNNDFNILHMHTSKGHTLGVIAGILGLKAKMILTRRVDVPVKNNFASSFKYNYRKILKIICISEEIVKIMSPHIREKTKIEVIYSGINLNRFNQNKLTDVFEKFYVPKGRKLIGNTSALTSQKDYPTFITTAVKLLSKRDDLHFIIFGDGPDKKKIEVLLKEGNVEDHFTLTGFTNELEVMLPRLDVFLFTSKNEGLGTSILDAFIAEVPVVATNAGGIIELIEDRVTGLISEIGDSEKLADNIFEVLNNESLRLTLINNAKEKAQSFSKEKMTEKYFQLYNAI